MSLRATLCLAALLAGCQAIPTLRPYKMDVQQGNVVTREMLARLQPGMTRNQVRFTLGTPLVVDPFRSDRWDYVYRYTKQGAVTEQRRIVVVFKDDKLLRFESEVIPLWRDSTTQGGVTIDKPAAARAGAPEKL